MAPPPFVPTPGFGPIFGNVLYDVCQPDSEKAAWLVPPHHHAIESSLVGCLTLWLLVKNCRSFHKHHTHTHSPTVLDQVSAQTRSILTKVVDAVLFLVMVASLLLICYHKYQANKLVFLLQPCHVLHIMLLVILCCSRASRLGALLFNLYLHLLWGPFLGLVAADLDCYTQRFELFNWGFQHSMLLVIPIYFIATRRFPLYTGRSFFILSYCILVLFHYGVLVPVSILSSANLNYVTCPPPTVPPLLAMGRWYRLPTLFACILLAWGMRYGFVEFIVWLVGGSQQQQSKRTDRRGQQAVTEVVGERLAKLIEDENQTPSPSPSPSASPRDQPNGIETNGNHDEPVSTLTRRVTRSASNAKKNNTSA